MEMQGRQCIEDKEIPKEYIHEDPCFYITFNSTSMDTKATTSYQNAGPLTKYTSRKTSMPLSRSKSCSAREEIRQGQVSILDRGLALQA